MMSFFTAGSMEYAPPGGNCGQVRERIPNYSQGRWPNRSKSWHFGDKSCMLAREIRLFFTAWMFFTRVPLPARLAAWVGHSPELMNGAVRYFPLTGIFVGLAGAAVFEFCIWLFTPLVAVSLSMAATVLFTGAFHEDGFADVCDGFGGGYTPDRVLEIMKDSRVGAFGAIGIALLLLIKFSALLSLAEGPDPELAAAIIVAGHALSRIAPPLLIRSMTYVRAEADAKAKPLAQQVSLGGLLVALAFGVLPLAFMGYGFDSGWLFSLGVVPVLLATAFTGIWFKRRIGGYTGDCLGAAQQVAEVVFYLFTVALLAVPAD
jgi:adenosylcobinamide-GDP ribazoletransferase